MAIRSFRSGDRVLVDNLQRGTIISVFPDGIHVVRLDRNRRTEAVTAAQLILTSAAPQAHGSGANSRSIARSR